MEKIKLGRFTTVYQGIKNFLAEKKEKVLYRVEVVPLDYSVTDFSTPRFIITKNYLIFTYDRQIEVYNMDKLGVDFLGGPPKFTLWQQLLEGNFSYTLNDYETLSKLKSYDNLFKISLAEEKSVNKDFLFRQAQTVKHSYQTWALGKIIEKVSELRDEYKKENFKELSEMLYGNFSYFNKSIFLLFIAVFVGYLSLKIIFSMTLPQVAETILNWGFAGIMLGTIVWVFYSQEKNNKRFRSVYRHFTKK